MKLNIRQEKFVQEYMKDLNATQAAARAGYSKKRANETAARLLTYPQVQAEITRLKKKMADKNEGLAQAVIDELKKVGFSNVQDFIGGDNSVVDLSELEKDKVAAVSSVKKVTTTFGGEDGGIKESVEFKLWDKVSALEKLGRHLGLFEEDNRQKAAQIITVTDTDD